MNFILKKKIRCECKNIINNSTCKNKFYEINIINNKKFCTFHYKYYTNYYATIIQKNYRSFKCRKTINNIYIKLPIDLQNKIINYIREKYYHEKYIKTLENIVLKKLINEINYISDILNYTKIYNPNTMLKLENYIYNNTLDNHKNIENKFKLYTKYFYCIKNNKDFEIIKDDFQKRLKNFRIKLQYSPYQQLFNYFHTLTAKIFYYLNPEVYNIDY